MHIRRSARGVEVCAPAKLNLFFELLGDRDDGFHEVATLMCPVNLYDTLFFRVAPAGTLRLRCRPVFGLGGPEGRGLQGVDAGPDNLVNRAVELVRRRAGVDFGADMLLVKRIPAAAGLGGGSSDAAAALVAANEAWQLGISRRRLSSWAAELGSDVPFFLEGGAAECRGRGERIAPVEHNCEMHFVLVRPPEGLATAAVYAAARVSDRPRETGPLMDAFKRGDCEETGRRLWNRLQPAAKSLSPWVARLEEEFVRLGLSGHAMSGSGTSYFGICRSARHARRIAGRLRAKGIGVVFAVRSCR